MKLIKTLLLMICLLALTPAFAAHQLYADKDGINIPYGTKLELQMAQNLTTKQVSDGDIFQAYLKKDIYVNNKLALPAKTLFRGRISSVTHSKMLSRPAILRLTLDHIVTKYGTQVSVNAGMSTSFKYVLKPDGSLTTNGNYFKAVSRDVKKAGAIVPRTVKWGKTSGDNLFTGARYVFVPVAAVGGSVACACSATYNTIADLFRHGDEVAIKKGETFEIMLLSNLYVPN